jgi:hypothetical protein
MYRLCRSVEIIHRQKRDNHMGKVERNSKTELGATKRRKLHFDVADDHVPTWRVLCLNIFRKLHVSNQANGLTSLYILMISNHCSDFYDRLCGLVVRVLDYRYRGPGFDLRALQKH